MKNLFNFENCKPIKYQLINTADDRHYVKIYFLALTDSSSSDKKVYYGKEHMDIIEVFETFDDSIKSLLNSSLKSVSLKGYYDKFNFKLVEYSINE